MQNNNTELPDLKDVDRIVASNKATQYYRIARIVLHTLAGFFIASILIPLASKARKLKLISWWCKYLLGSFNIKVLRYGQIPPHNQPLHNTIFVANHVSWADIHALSSTLPIRFIAKSEIKNWPIFGYLANKANALFIDRAKRQDAALTVKIAAASLQNGDNLCLFPEGTTTDGTVMKPFKSSLIQAGIDSKATIWPIAIRYPLPNGHLNIAMAYAGETTLPESMYAVLKQKYPIVELHFLKPINIADLNETERDRRTLTLHVETLIRQELKLFK